MKSEKNNIESLIRQHPVWFFKYHIDIWLRYTNYGIHISSKLYPNPEKKTKTIFLLDFNKHETIFGWYTIRHCINDSIRSRQHQHIQMMLKWHHKKHLCVHRHCQLQIETKKKHSHNNNNTPPHIWRTNHIHRHANQSLLPRLVVCEPIPKGYAPTFRPSRHTIITPSCKILQV